MGNMGNDGDYSYKRKSLQYVDSIFKFLTYFEVVFVFCITVKWVAREQRVN